MKMQTTTLLLHVCIGLAVAVPQPTAISASTVKGAVQGALISNVSTSIPKRKLLRPLVSNQVSFAMLFLVGWTTIGEGDAKDCDFPGIDLYQKVDAVVKELPPEYSQPDRKPEEVIPGVFLGTIVYKGLDNFRSYGPVFSYCRNGTRLVQVDLATDDRLMEAFMPWKTCGGQQGSIGTYASARVTVTFKLVDASAVEPFEKNQVTLDHHSGPTPVSVHDVSVYLRGAGDTMGGAVAITSKLFPQLPKEFWLDMVTWRLRTVLKEVIWKLSSGI